MTPVQAWIQAARFRTLAAAFVPVAIGSSLAFRDGAFRWDAGLIALICAFLIQIGTNFANDYYDFKKGTDTEDRVGFTRATAGGYISPQSMFTATYLTLGLAFLTGLYLVSITDWQILALGLASLLFGVLYTGGPYPLGYNGLGDLFVFLFFGLAAVMGTYYVHTQVWSEVAFWCSIPAGALSVNILVVNNLRDVEQDRQTGKRTLGVLLGEQTLRYEYVLMLIMAYSIPPHLWFWEHYSYWIFLPLLSFPMAIPLVTSVFTESHKPNLNQTLTSTARYMFVFGVLFSVGIILS